MWSHSTLATREASVLFVQEVMVIQCVSTKIMDLLPWTMVLGMSTPVSMMATKIVAIAPEGTLVEVGTKVSDREEGVR